MKKPRESDADIAHAVCAGCGCLCDDISVRFRDEEAVKIDRACPMGETWMRSLGPLEPRALLRGKPASIDDALEAARKLIADSRAPAVVGLHGLTVEALREAVALGEAIAAPLLPCPAIPEALLRSGIHAPECTATLGEVRSTADLIVFWRSDPERTHPRHLERYSLEPELLSGRKRVLVVADSDASNATARRAAELIPLAAENDRRHESDLAVIRGVRLRLERADAQRFREADGDGRAVDSVYKRITASRHAHFFLGTHAVESPALWNAFHLLAAKGREKHRITVSAMPAPGNARGVLEVLSWSTGHVAPLVAAGRVLELRATDLVVALAMDADSLAPSTRKIYDGTRRIVMGTSDDPAADVSIRIPGLDPRLAATVARSDGVLLSLNGRGASQPEHIDPGAQLLARLRAVTVSGRPR